MPDINDDETEVDKNKQKTMVEQANELLTGEPKEDDKKEKKTDYPELDMMIKLQEEMAALYKDMGSAAWAALKKIEEQVEENADQQNNVQQAKLDADEATAEQIETATEEATAEQIEEAAEEDDMEMNAMSDTTTKPADAVNSSDFEGLEKETGSAKGVDVDEELEQDAESQSGLSPF